jgi:hypothetical protein
MPSTDPILQRTFVYCETDSEPPECDPQADVQEVGALLSADLAELAVRLSLVTDALEDIERRGLACAYVDNCRLINKRLDGSETDGGAFTSCTP